ncbi:MAG: lysostaphin resistance A-like protein [Terriglobales bacterium]
MDILFDHTGRLRSIWRFLAGVIVCIVANFIAGGIAQTVASTPRRLDIVYRPTLMLLLLAGFSFLLMALDRVERNPLAAMGLPFHALSLVQTAIGLLIGSGMIVLAVAVIAVFGGLQVQAKFTPHAILLAGVELVILLTGAMAEELMFRGYPFQRLIEAIGPPSAIVVFSLLFGAVHLRNPHASLWGFLNTILVGVLFSVAYLRTRSLWTPCGMHFSWNAMLGLIFGLPVSGLTEFAVVVRSHAGGPVWLTGGEYGIEASALGTFVLVLGLIAVLRFVPKYEPLARATRNRSIALQSRE